MSEGSGPPEEKALPVSMWTDEKLRPWTIDEKLDQDIDDANERLNSMMNKTSGSKLAGECAQIISVLYGHGDTYTRPLFLCEIIEVTNACLSMIIISLSTLFFYYLPL